MFTAKQSYRIQYGIEIFSANVYLNGTYIGSTSAYSERGLTTQIQSVINRSKGIR